MSENPPRKTAAVSLVVSLIAGVLFFAPGFLGIDGFDGGFAISFVSLLVVVVGVIVALYYFSLSGRLDRILRGEGVLAHWTYSTEFWREYTEKECSEEKTEKKGLFIMVSVIALIVGFVFVLVDPEAGLFVFAVMLGLIGLVAFVWQFSSWYDYRQNVNGVREVFIARNAVYLNKKFITWRTVLTSFDGVTLRKSRSIPMLVFTYTVTNVRYGPQSYTTRVPIPPGEEENAKEIVKQINEQT